VQIGDFQQLIRDIYGEKDGSRRPEQNLAWLMEEVGELARALRQQDRKALQEEFADVAAWLTSLASQLGVDMEQAVQRYAGGCPKCRATPCACPQ